MFHSVVSTTGAAARLLAVTSVAAFLLATGATAQTAPPDPVVATVDGQAIHLSEVQEAAEGMPGGHGKMNSDVFPSMLDQLIDGKALVAEARRTGLDKDPAVQRQVLAAQERALETALLHREIGPKITEEALRARFEQDVAGKPGEEEVHARHILVPDEATAIKVIAELKKGADFAGLSNQYSKDPGAAHQGGDLGFFKKSEMVPEFATAAFALKDKEITATPVKTDFGWHVIQVLERRQAAVQDFDKTRDSLRQKLIQEGVQGAITRARAAVQVTRFNMDGSSVKATDSAVPPAH